MTWDPDHRGKVLPEGAIRLPAIGTKAIRHWSDTALWGHHLYDDQSPWMALLECLHILHHRQHDGQVTLFQPPVIGLDDRTEHEHVRYDVPLNFHLRHFLFRDREAASISADHDSDNNIQWKNLFERTSSWKDSKGVGLDVRYLRDRFADVASLARALDLLRSAEIDPMSGKRWTSRHLLPLGPALLFADVRESSYQGDRRFVRRTGEVLYLMLGRSQPYRRKRLTKLIRKRLMDAHSAWNKLAAHIQPPSDYQSVRFTTGYLPYPGLKVYDHLAEDWIQLLSLSRIDAADLFDPLMRISALHQVIYILFRAQETVGGDGLSFPPFVFDLAVSSRKNPIQRTAAGQYDSHMKLPRRAIDAFIDAFAQTPCWKRIDERDHETANKRLERMWLCNPSDAKGTRTERLEEFRETTTQRSGHSIWSVVRNHTRKAGLTVAQPGAGTWYAPNDAMLEALVLANVQDPQEFGEFLRVIYKKYRIVVGQEQAQVALGNSAMSLDRFKLNEHRLEERLRVLRLIDRKSDACAFVVNPFFRPTSDFE